MRQCDICKADAVRSIELYPFGSEGLTLCQSCINRVAQYALDLALEAQRGRKAAAMERRGNRTK